MKKKIPFNIRGLYFKTVLLCSLTESEHRLDAYMREHFNELLFTASSTLPAMQW